MRYVLPILSVLSLAGCGVVGPSCSCPEVEAIARGEFAVFASEPPLNDAVVAIEADRVIVRYVDADGAEWEAEYAVVDEYP